MTSLNLRDIYTRYLRGTPLGNAARRLWYWNWRNAARPAANAKSGVMSSLGVRQGRLAIKQGNVVFEKGRAAVEQGRLFTYRVSYVARYYWPKLRASGTWLLESRETSNFTYDLTPRNELHLARLLAVATGKSAEQITGYFDEIRNDAALRKAIINHVKRLGRQGGYDPVARFGRRIGWYALVRAMKPTVVIETGVEKGMGAMVLCAALLRNLEDGSPGRYYGTDIDRGAGKLFCEPYCSMGEILYGDSIESLSSLDETVDIFINDSDHSADYEGREYRVIAPKLAEHAIIVGDNAHVTDELLKFSDETGRKFLFFREEPADHWYLGASIGLSFRSTGR